MLPNIWPTVSVNLALQFGVAVLAEASLSYLGLGAPPPNASWGRLLQEAQGTVLTAPVGAIAPGVVLVVLVIGVNLLADGLRDVADPDPKAALDEPARGGLAERHLPGRRRPVRDVSFTLAPGERLGLIGESGSGKSLTAFAVIGLLPPGSRPAAASSSTAPRSSVRRRSACVPLRGRVCAFVFQEPLTALDPLMTLGRQLAEPIAPAPGPARSRRSGEPSCAALDEVHLPEPERIAASRSYEISGGQRQRVAIAMALACRPQLLIADEPTTALDVTVQAEVLTLLDRLVADRGMALLFVSHDLAVVARMTDHALVMRAGEAVERGRIARAPGAPRHPYTAAFAASARDRDALRCSYRPGTGRVTAILALDDVSYTYRGGRRAQPAVQGVSLSVTPGQNVGLVGESGSGKTTLLQAPARPAASGARAGSCSTASRSTWATDRRCARFRRSVQTVFQDPYSSLDPRQRVGRIVGEPVRSLRIARGREADAAASRRRSSRSGCRPMPRPVTRTSSRAGSGSASPSPGPS